jgi:lipoate-protein ligase A
MAVDEAVLEAVASGAAGPTLRIYGWRGRWLSVGMAESIADVDRAAAAAAGIGLVRRPSGGAAVLHVDQLAWSLTLPAGHAFASPDIVESYRGQAAIALDFCARIGVAARAVAPDEARAPLPDPLLALACFGGLAPHEIVVGAPPRKLVGWGQVRRRGVVMHHAVLSRRFDPEALAGLLRADRARLAGALDRRVTDLRQEAGRAITLAELLAALSAAHDAAGLVTRPGRLGEAERRRAGRLVAEKYRLEGWTSRR